MRSRFAEVEAVTIITMLLSRYRIVLDPEGFKDVAGETLLERRERLFAVRHILTMTPLHLPLIFSRRE